MAMPKLNAKTQKLGTPDHTARKTLYPIQDSEQLSRKKRKEAQKKNSVHTHKQYGNTVLTIPMHANKNKEML